MSAYRIFLLLSAVGSFAGHTAWTLNLVYQVQVIGLDPLQLILVGTLMEAVCFAAQVPTGVIADLYSRRLSVIIGYLLMGAGLLLWGLVPTYAAILAANVVWAIGAVCVDGALEAWAGDELGADRAGPAFARGGQLAQLGGVLGIGAAVALASLDLALPIVVGAGVTLALGVLLALTMPEQHFTPARAALSPHPTDGTSPIDTRTRDDEAAGHVGSTEAASAMGAAVRSMGGQVRAGFKVIRRSPALLSLVGATLFLAMSSEGFDRLSQPHFLADLRFPTALSPLVWLGLGTVAAMLGSVAVTEVIRRRVDLTRARPIGRLLAWLEAGAALAVVAFALAGSFWAAVAAYLVAGLLRTAVGPLLTALLVAETESATRATVISMQAQVDALGQIAGGPPVGALGRGSLPAGISASGLLLLPAAAIFALADLRRRPAADPPGRRAELDLGA
ncbi:MFS transporter [Catellatospora tritici]|uniref:MFS transporter n=1 Tax=Catellatospora tritici TaxID=2851566 RepID=UPI001C2CCA98|nr:MFS transporter [Catellatospora tritici]MBV1851874.1 MFS transporter [Catellatospora tritici]